MRSHSRDEKARNLMALTMDWERRGCCGRKASSSNLYGFVRRLHPCIVKPMSANLRYPLFFFSFRRNRFRDPDGADPRKRTTHRSFSGLKIAHDNRQARMRLVKNKKAFINFEVFPAQRSSSVSCRTGRTFRFQAPVLQPGSRGNIHRMPLERVRLRTAGHERDKEQKHNS